MKKIRGSLFIVIIVFMMVFISSFAFASEVRISFWHVFSPNSIRGKTLQSLVDDFNSKGYMVADKRVVVESVYKGGKGRYNNPYNVLFSELLKASYSKDLPNVSIAYENWVSQFKEIDVIKDMDSFNSQEINQYINSLYPEFRKSSIIDGNVYSLPFNKSLFVFYYNKDMVDDLPTNFEAFISKLENIKDKIGYPPLFLEVNEDTFIIFYLLSISGNFFEINQRIIPTFLGSNLEKTTNLVDELYRRGLIKWTDNSYRDFIENKAPVILATTSKFTDLKKKSSRYAISSLPADNGKIYAAGTNLVIFNSDKEKELASLKFVEFLIKPENLEYFCTNTGYIVPTEKYGELYDNFLQSNPDYKKVLDYSKNRIYVQPPIWAWENIRYFLNDYMVNVFVSKIPLSDSQKEIENKVNQIIFNQNQKFRKN
ncbi:MAG: extracellular solute-binding protein [bacterium]